jgi:hypothetical protein
MPSRAREGSNKKSYFTKIGAAWPTKSGSGYNADLIALPVDGKFILLPPKDKEDVRVIQIARRRASARRLIRFNPETQQRSLDALQWG